MIPSTITAEQYRKVLAMTEISELDKLGQYGAVTLIQGDTGNLTYGRFQTTLSSGNLYILIKDYVEEGGQYSDAFKPFLTQLQRKDTSLNHDTKFRDLLKKAGNDPVMHSVQDEFFTKVYWASADAFFTKNSFTLPLSLAIIHDSFIHSGGILNFLRNRFAAVPPAAGGSEKRWITDYLNARHDWLANHERKDLRNSSYRTKELKKLVAANHWDLATPYKFRGHDL